MYLWIKFSDNRKIPILNINFGTKRNVTIMIANRKEKNSPCRRAFSEYAQTPRRRSNLLLIIIIITTTEFQVTNSIRWDRGDQWKPPREKKRIYIHVFYWFGSTNTFLHEKEKKIRRRSDNKEVTGRDIPSLLPSTCRSNLNTQFCVV